MSREVTERLKSLLKAKFEGVSDSILNRISERISKSAQSVDDATTLAEGVSFQQVLESYGDSRATKAQETAIRNYEKRYGLKEGVRVEAEGSVNANEEVFKEGVQDIGAKSMDAQPGWLRSLLNTNKALTKRIDILEADKIVSTRRQKLAEVVNRLPNNGLRKAYERTPVEGISDEDFNSMIGEIGKEVEGIMKDSRASGAVFGRPTSMITNSGGDELSREQMEAIGRREGSTRDGQPF